ncbi:MAG: LysM peptidoglycan-binding protein [Frankiales bacterium]|jgi:LysM repeat protein|nr:LysM peptidoglycan-binding protein [Frankiales bacterium]
MTRTTRTRRVPGRSGRATLGALVALAVVVTAGAPSVITVRPGDTLWDLAREHGTTVSSLRRLNDLPGNGTLYAGSTLRVGSGSSTGSSGGSGSYVVRRGDTLSEIAVRFGTTSAAIRKANRMSSSTVYAGRRLSIPGAGSGTSSVPSTNAGKRIPEPVRRSVAQNRATLAARSHPSKPQVRRMVAATARRHGVSPSLAVAVAYHESGFQQRVVSGVNAIGVMQVLPATGRVIARQHGRSLDLLKTQDNITAGVLLLRQLQRSTPTTDRLLAGYYQGAGSIARQGILPQTRDYIRSISILRKRFANG